MFSAICPLLWVQSTPNKLQIYQEIRYLALRPFLLVHQGFLGVDTCFFTFLCQWQYLLLSLQPKKLGFSNLTHLRRRRPDASTDYVCPVESSLPQSGPSTVNGVQVRPYVGFRGLSPILDQESERSRDQVGVKESRPDQSPWQLWQNMAILCCPVSSFS